MANVILEIKREGIGDILREGNVLFDTLSKSSPGITYNPSAGVVTFDSPGLYSVEWWVATETAPKGTIDFELTSSQNDTITDRIPGCSPIKTGQVSGFGVVDVKTSGTKLWLASKSDVKIIFSINTGVKAYMLITQIREAYPNVYHANLSTSGSFYEINIGNVVYRLQYTGATTIAMYLKSISGTVVVDVKRSAQYEAAGVEGQSVNNYNLTTTPLPMDGTIYNYSNEMQRTWIRQKDPVSELWSLHEVQLFPSAYGARVSICVYPIYKDMDLTGL